MEAKKAAVAALNGELWRVTEQFRRGFARVIDPGRYGVLTTVAAHDGIRPTEIAEALDMVPSSVSRHVAALASEHLVELIGNPHDRRSSLVQVTEAGRETLRRFDETGRDASAAVLADWSTADVRALTDLLRRLAEAWDSRGAGNVRPGRLGPDDTHQP
jgi:DNA-binding MarR family transcriptional regulator